MRSWETRLMLATFPLPFRHNNGERANCQALRRTKGTTRTSQSPLAKGAVSRVLWAGPALGAFLAVPDQAAVARRILGWQLRFVLSSLLILPITLLQEQRTPQKSPSDAVARFLAPVPLPTAGHFGGYIVIRGRTDSDPQLPASAVSRGSTHINSGYLSTVSERQDDHARKEDH